jgi:hypothetical protein
MSAATVVVSSAEGAGDMPSSVPVAGGDSSQDDAPPFSEVLSLSSADHPSSSGSSSPTEPAPVPDEARDQSEGTAATVSEVASASTAGGSPVRAQRRGGPSERDDGHVPRTIGSPKLSRAGKTDQIIPSGPTQGQPGEGIAIDADRSLGATRPLATSATPAAPGLSLRSTTAVAATASDGTPASAVRAGSSSGNDVLSTLAPALEGDPDPSTVASSATHVPHTPGAGSTGENQAPAAVTAAENAEVRALADRGSAPASLGVRPVPVRIVVNGSAPDAAASALSASAPGTPGPASVSAEELSEFPDVGEGTAGVDISDLAASISRPLAGGSGDYSVQVSLHPPELGEVRALLSLQGDVLHVTLTPDHSTGFDALSDAMPALHEQLAGGGVEVHVTLGQPGDPEGGDGRAAAEAGRAAKAPSDDAPPAVSGSPIPIGTGGPGRIHLVL